MVVASTNSDGGANAWVSELVAPGGGGGSKVSYNGIPTLLLTPSPS